MKNSRRKLFEARSLLAALFLCMSIMVFAQTKTITGTVVDEKGESIIGATVSVKGTTTGTMTDLDGKFSISVNNNDVLTVSYVGYAEQSISIAGKNEIRIVMKEDSHVLDEFVVIGYGVVKKSDLTGAVSKMNAESIGERPLARVESALQGSMPGITVRTITGEPGQDMQIRVRGAASVSASSDPLYVIDGVPSSTLVGLNPSDIQSMEVLKDAASAAIYGSRGSNGVIMVTTKKGKSGKTKVSFSASYGIQMLQNKLDLLSGEEWIDFYTRYNDANYLNLAKNNKVTNASIKDDNATRLKNIGAKNPNYSVILDDRWQHYLSPEMVASHTFGATDERLAMLDWQDNFYRTAPVMDYNINLSGGNDNTTYLFSLGYFDQDGIATGTGYKRFTLRANIDSKINKWLSVGMKLAPSYSIKDGAGRANGKDSEAHRVLASSPVSPADVGYNTNIEPNDRYPWAGSSSSPTAVMKRNKRRDYDARVSAIGYIRVNPLEGLQVEGTASTTYTDLDGQTYSYSDVTGNWNLGEGVNSSGGHNTRRKFDNTLLQLVANYNKSFNEKHNLTLMAGMSTEQNQWGFETNQSFNKPFPNDAIDGSFDGNNLPIGTDKVTELTPDRLVSYFGRVQYDYMGRYLLSASVRRDGGSVFGSQNRWGTFPALSAAWKVSEESFFKGLNISNVIDQFKLRVSYGATGNKQINGTNAYTLLSSVMYAGANGYSPSSLGNSNLGWEKANSTDLAFDLSMFNNRIQMSVDWYTKNTKDLLYEVPIPLASGYGTYWDNLGNIKNNGFEFELTTHNINKGLFKWSTTFNFSYNQNEVKSLGIDDTPIYSGFDKSNFSNVLEVGHPINTFYMYEAVGVWMNQKEIDDFSAAHGGKAVTFSGKQIKPGDIRYRDVDGSGDFTTDDKTYLGSPTPKCTYGMTNTFSYKDFDLSILLTAQTGGKILGLIGRAIDRPGQGPSTNAFAHWKNAWWSEENPGDGKTPYPLSTTTGATIDSRWLYSSDYLSIKNITLGYNVPINKSIISNARVYFSAENLATFTSYDGGYSPEASNSGSSSAPGGSAALGLDYSSYPLARTFTIGLNLTF